MSKETVAILGGTGDQGLGLALRFAKAGRKVLIGSRKVERAVEAADDVRKQVPSADVSGLDNAAAVGAARGAIVILSIPFEHTVSTVKSVADQLTPETVLVSMGVPLATAIGGSPTRVLQVAEGSCAELVQSIAPKGVAVISAFQNVAAHRLMQLDADVECDVIISGAKDPRKRVMALCDDISGARAIDGGPLINARYVEQWTALLIGINIRYKIPDGAGLRITHV